MVFVVENGSGLPDANSYVSVIEADAYHADRGNTAWTGADAVKQTALVRATDYIEQIYSERWQGAPMSMSQALVWPRGGVANTPSDIVPVRLKQAVCQLALEAVSGIDLNPTLDRAVKKEKVGPLETEYMDNASVGEVRPAIDGLLRALLRGVGLNGRVVRV